MARRSTQITIRGQRFEIDRDQVITAVRGVQPEAIRSYYIELEGQRYPIKQVIRRALRIHAVAFTSMDAYRVLDKLGFEIRSIED